MSATGIDIQIAVPEDAAAIYHVQRQTWLATYPNAAHGVTKQDIEAKFPLGADAEEAIERKRILLRAQSAGAREWIAKDAGAVVGWAVGLIKQDKHELAAMYVLPDYQGKRVGGKLIAAALEWLGDNHEVTLTVATYNRKAIEFYKRWGFRSLGPDPETDSILPSGAGIPSLKMIRPAAK
ncbi:MAG TPA: GNAT family N-acetyltransferase [Candidatus Polarisedimenticolaceae bacterium]|nr:GNAT family N-acetyltransferase [Candidatus Polarisedimenticolaceae bacterium]